MAMRKPAWSRVPLKIMGRSTLSCIKGDWESLFTLFGSFMGPATNMLRIWAAMLLNIMVEISSFAPK